LTTLKFPVDVEQISSVELRCAFLAAMAGAEVLVKYFESGVAMRAKAGEQSYNLVTDADLESEKVIGGVINKHLPQHAILAE